ncbi:hypothetical protein IFM89_020849 [Coptis chinensis]|uniref:PTC1-like winged helix-turn-helix domain-containing protein n=1 Tax=Coptis chinensis TaxID=261450 RepID=A0A835IXM6_9MAGN|nr:hypothetical protein IFM89_020849 [Coptis chinensis]
MLNKRVNSSRMKANLWKQEDIPDFKCSKRQDMELQKPPLGRSVLPIPDRSYACNGPEPVQFKTGFLYEIDHKQMPLKFRTQLEAIRAVMVTELDDQNVYIRFPSTLSLRAYFSNMNPEGVNLQGRIFPDLDEEFVMSLKLARIVLIRLISPDEFANRRHLRSFWLLPSKGSDVSSSVVNEDLKDETSLKGLCWSSLNCSGLVHWGVRRKVTYLGGNSEKTPGVLSLPSRIKEEDVNTELKTEVEAKRKQVEFLSRVIKEEEDDKMDLKTEDETKPKSRKRKHEGGKLNKPSKAAKRVVKKTSRRVCEQEPKFSYGRWTKERYKSGELLMMQILKKKGAVFGKPVPRQTLRVEARKDIGDTGFLDHLLKHMIEAGVKDPYWNPPPGWTPGDNPSQEPDCASELKLLKEEMANIRKDLQELLLMKREDEVDNSIVISTKSSSESCNSESDTKVVSLQEDYENLVKRKAELEQQLAQIRKRKDEGGIENRKSREANDEVDSSKTNKQKSKLSYSWWSQDRYDSAEMKLLEIMKAKGAVYGKPILRHTLRMEARKHIVDAGFLDHVMKHMADKVAPNGKDRFRRRYSPDGAMEYWLESADLVNVRREAGVKDPYWNPPPGWEPGDSPSHDPDYAWELQVLKEEMSKFKKDVQELYLWKREDEVDKAIEIPTKSSSDTCNFDTSSKVGKQKLKLSYGRWSQQRYKNAEVKMLDILKANGAVLGKPITRQALRMEARNYIGDTGLLDHILKHMSDKVAPNGEDRFRRRHNPDGTMVYWLESADLLSVRKEGGVEETYFTPLLGWKAGDYPSQDTNCAWELKLLKEEMSNIKRDVQALLQLKREDEGDKSFVISTKSSSESCNSGSDAKVVSLQEDLRAW